MRSPLSEANGTAVLLLPELPIHISELVGRAYLTRGALLWAGTRVLAGIVLLSASGNPVRLHPAMAASLVVVVFILSYLDLKRRRETTLLHDLGIPAMLVVAIATIPAAFAESAIGLAGRLVR